MRDYLYISDLVSFVVAALREDLSGVYNVGSGEGHSVVDILSIVPEVSGLSPQGQFLPARGFDVKNVVLDISKACNDLGWAPKLTLREGCHRYWNWLMEASK